MFCSLGWAQIIIIYVFALFIEKDVWISAINAENAAHKSEKFMAMATRTRQEYLKDLATNFVTSTSLDSASKFSA